MLMVRWVLFLNPPLLLKKIIDRELYGLKGIIRIIKEKWNLEAVS